MDPREKCEYCLKKELYCGPKLSTQCLRQNEQSNDPQLPRTENYADDSQCPSLQLVDIIRLMKICNIGKGYTLARRLDKRYRLTRNPAVSQFTMVRLSDRLKVEWRERCCAT